MDIGKFIEKARRVHGNKYDYSKAEYKNTKTKIVIICPHHGEFQQIPSNHLYGFGCIKCGRISSRVSSILSIEEFIEKARKVHGDKYDYSKVDYKNYETKIAIICPTHGIFHQTPASHLSGCGCNKCYLIDTNRFVEKARRIHGNKYDYSKVEYKNYETKVSIICPKHGIFYQSAGGHLRGRGCSKCACNTYLSTTEEFIEKARKVHGGKYDYSQVDYKNVKTKITIICPEHGEFKQTPNDHLSGYGCQQCAYEICTSVGELELANFMKSFDVEVQLNTRDFIKPYELDIVIPEYKLAIEYDGLFWHSCNNLVSESKNYHLNKTRMCENVGYRLIHVFENEWLEKPDIIKSKLLYMLGRAQNKAYARKCRITELDNKQTAAFFDESHIQGHRPAKIAYGLKHNDELVAAISFSRRSDQWEIIRYAVKPYYSVVGGFSKLLRHFIKSIDPKSIITYADRRYSDGGLYKNNGFELIKVTKPNYYYVLGNKLFSRQAFQKRKLADKLGKFDPQKTEAENMFANGYRRIWDCGHYKYRLQR